MAKIISLVNHKGGVAKSTSALNIAGALRDLGNKVLLIDLDSQANLTLALHREELEFTIGHVLVGEASFDQALLKTSIGIDMIGASFELNQFEIQIAKEKFSEFVLKKRLDLPQVHAYDYIVIDTPPALGVLTINALLFTNYYLIPLQADFFSIQGVKTILESAATISQFNEGLEFVGAFLTRFNKSSNKIIDRDVYSHLSVELGSKLLDTTIRENTALNVAIVQAQDIFSYEPSANGATDYKKLTEEVLERT
ncbi:chromosome partitioning protein [Pontibacter ummariensis]|uniref:Chromosome partitioning protein n=1 Tax=Pontibacter ummariensis TaxID=1610492 RepID=A0A239IXI1_9BACT|nr:ParA family protein [Pontibacter ummariensis]PRY09008.1 chromosome partitioning protein [Pontibacter ummariensis]SNS98225.1 chromosome partitioning protein [Pontibacter ummariensis]